MSEEKKIEDSLEDGKSESSEDIKSETLSRQMRESNVSEESKINKSAISKSAIAMEVHHHPKVEKKHFKEYFLEFVMIFLAVTMGFFAESLREHMADKSKEKEFITSLKEDIVSDTTQLSRVLPYRDFMFGKLDSLYFLLQAAADGKRYDMHR